MKSTLRCDLSLLVLYEIPKEVPLNDLYRIVTYEEAKFYNGPFMNISGDSGVCFESLIG